MRLQELEGDGESCSQEKGMSGRVDTYCAKRAVAVTRFW